MDATAADLVDSFLSLPWKYKVLVPLPNAVGISMLEHLGALKISSTIELVRVDDTIREMLNPKVPEGPTIQHGFLARALLGAAPKLWGDCTAAIAFEIYGYQGQYGFYEPAKEALNDLESIIGICYTCGMIEPSQRWWISDAVAVQILQVHDDRIELVSSPALDRSRSRMLSMLGISPSIGHAHVNSMRWGLLGRALTDCFRDKDQDRSQKILLAAKWLCDSLVSEDVLLPFVQATVALEILLGDQSPNKELGLGELLQTGAAYFIAESHDERDQILRDFSKIYDVRCAIVHKGKHKLNSHDLALMGKLQSIVTRIIMKELHLLQRAPLVMGPEGQGRSAGARRKAKQT